MSINQPHIDLPGWVEMVDRTANFIRVQLLKKNSKRNLLKAKYLFKKRSKALATIDTVLPEIEYLVYYGDRSGGNHFKLWDPVFDKVAGRYASIFRYSKMWWDYRENDSVIPTSSIAHITPLLARMPNLKAIFYPANNGVNLQTIRNGHIQHVFLGHGDSDKSSSANKVFRLYDEVWTAGQGHIDRFAQTDGNFSSIDFRIVGQPWMKDWLLSLPEYSPEQRLEWGYFPTWAGSFQNSSYASTHLFDQIAPLANDAIPNGNGFVKLHPWSTTESVSAIEDVSAPFNGTISVVPQVEQLRDVLSRPLKFLLTDISGALTECLYINVPIFLFRPPPPALLNDDFDKQNAFCYIYSTPAELEALLKRVIVDGDDYLAGIRTEFLSYRVNIDKTLSDQFSEELTRLNQS